MRNYFYRKEFELIFSIFIIAVLAVLQIKAYLPARTSAITAHSLGASFQYARVDDACYYALHGEWPEDNNRVGPFGFTEKYTEYGVFDDVRINNGAINLHYESGLPGKTMTLRPAVPANDKFGPLIWIVGNYRPESEWHVFGEDHTNIEDRYISSHAR